MKKISVAHQIITFIIDENLHYTVDWDYLAVPTNQNISLMNIINLQYKIVKFYTV